MSTSVSASPESFQGARQGLLTTLAVRSGAHAGGNGFQRRGFSLIDENYFASVALEPFNASMALTLNRSLVPIAGMHVRHGDKKSDGFKHQSLEAQLEAVRHSKECLAHTAIAAPSSSSSSSSSPSSGNEGRSAEEDRGEAERARCFTAEGKPLEIYVASDDSSVLTAAAAMGHLVDSDGVSQTTHGKGMLTTLWNDVSMGYNATLEIIRDITLLSRCSTVVGIAASQVFRMAVGMSNATGTLQGSVFAMDHGQIGRIGAMSNKFHIPLVEHFEKPP